MIRLLFTLLYSSVMHLSIATSVWAVPTDALLAQAAQHVVKVHVALKNGNNGTGSGVVVAKNRIVTNCHVVANASSIHVTVEGVPYIGSAITPDWYHDVCLVTVKGLDAPIATIGASESLEYEQAVFAIGYPNVSSTPVRTFGHIKGLFPLDDSVIIRSSSTFKRGESGGGVFDDTGHLVGIITLKSPGKQTYYYNMPVEWVQALLAQPEQAITTHAKPAFWATSADQWPYFMQVVQPYLTDDFPSLMAVATQWTAQEPNNAEAWFYLAVAEYVAHDAMNAEKHMRKVIAHNAQHSQAIYYLGLITAEHG
jgi:serine protease Do